MTWKITLAPHGSSCSGRNKEYYRNEINQLHQQLIVADKKKFRYLLATSGSGGFKAFVVSVRQVCEYAYPNPNTTPQHAKDLLRNTNWACHAETSTAYDVHEDVNEAHCDRMVELFKATVSSYVYGPDQLADLMSNNSIGDGGGRGRGARGDGGGRGYGRGRSDGGGRGRGRGRGASSEKDCSVCDDTFMTYYTAQMLRFARSAGTKSEGFLAARM
eukprot:CAMPEP_0181393594 /NCGR_PEP_ID=MMETSP1106-20121128/27281_1 /TAXON_ID=81844 /ORGANISM="Mantoniella antarctica, Strain SL-175" /LENGTH=215 /DNA_ID=CAMNT_0023514941 /DNA_START=114 /DNA_END=762 /DNA_ORIENTATION=+